MAQDGRTLEDRLRRLEDIEEIRKLMFDYQRCLDARDLAGQASLFAPDGEWIGAYGRAQGPAAIEQTFLSHLAEVDEQLASQGATGGSTTVHFLGNPVIDVDGETATAEVPCAFIVQGADGAPVLHTFGHYHDTLGRIGGRWRFLRRVSYYDIPFGAPASI